MHFIGLFRWFYGWFRSVSIGFGRFRSVSVGFDKKDYPYCRTNYLSNTRDECKKTTFIYKATHALSIGVDSKFVAVIVNEILLMVEGVLWCPHHPHSTVFGHTNYSSNTKDECKKTTFPC